MFLNFSGKSILSPIEVEVDVDLACGALYGFLAECSLKFVHGLYHFVADVSRCLFIQHLIVLSANLTVESCG